MTWILDNLGLIGGLTLEHLRHSLPPLLIGLLLSLPLGWLAHRWRAVRGPIVIGTGLLYTLPSLALLPILPVVFGFSALSEINLTMALSIYAVAILVRSVCDGFDSVDVDVRRAAQSMGFGTLRRVVTVELPIAGPVILAGLRVTAMSTVSLATVGILIGVTNLGYLFTNGFQRRIVPEILAGVVAVALIAVVIDQLLALVGRALMPWERIGQPVRHKTTGENSMNLVVGAVEWLFDPDNWLGNRGLLAGIASHLLYTALAVLVAAVIAIPAGWMIGHTGRGRAVAVAVTGAARAIPSFGLILLLVLVMGVTHKVEATMVAFVLLAIPSILAGAYSGIDAIDPRVIDAARATGVSEWQILWRVEVPLGLPLLVAGIRSGVLQVVATVTLAAYVNLGGLGQDILQGIQLRNFDQVLGGALVVAALALVLDALFAVVQRLSVPAGIVAGTAESSRRRTTRRTTPREVTA